MSPMHWRIAAACGMAGCVAGCVRLDYVKVPTPTQYEKWTDEDQRRADAMEGVRYYLPRPFLNLKQSIPVAQRVALVSFRYDTAEKCYRLELPTDAPTWLKRAAPARISITQALALTMAGAPKSELQGTEAGGGDQPRTGPDTATAPRPPSELHARTGFINETDPVTRLSERMDVVYLPDFEEQYIIQPHSGLGTADVETRLRNGWAAEVFAQKVDNSNLIPYVIDQVEHASDAAAGIFTTWAPLALGLPPGMGLPTPQLQGSEAGDARELLSEVLLFKIAEVKVAQPGVYPILKPREMRQWFKKIATTQDPDISLEKLLQESNVQWIRPDMAFIPCPPFTVVGFNVTTDIFIVPATDRMQEMVTDNDKDPVDGASAAAKTVEGGLRAAKSTQAAQAALGAAEAAKLSFDKLTVSAIDSGAKTSVNVPTTMVAADVDVAKIQAWIDAVLDTGAPAATVTARVSPRPGGGFSLLIAIPKAPKDISVKP